MRPHGVAGLLRIALFHGFQDALVMKLPALGTAFNFEYPHPLLAKQANDEINQRENQGISRRFCQREMEIEIGFYIRIGIATGSVHDRNRFAHRGHVGFLCAGRCQLEQPARYHP